MAKKKLTEAVVSGLKIGERISDTQVPGFSAQRNRDGVVYKVKRDVQVNGVRETWGSTFKDAANLDKAREEAIRRINLMKEGKHPDRPEQAMAAAATPGIPTVKQMFETWVAAQLKAGKSQGTYDSAWWRINSYISDWLPLAATSIKRSDILARHTKIMADVKVNTNGKHDGARAANQTIGDFSAAWTHMADTLDDGIQLPANPVPSGKRYKAKERGRSTYIPEKELMEWWAAINQLPRLRRCMQSLGLLSGLRPGNLTTIRRAWVEDLDGAEPRIVFPADAMKNDCDFPLPLSPAMVSLVRDALAVGDMLKPGTPYLFPHDRDGNKPCGSWTEQKARTRQPVLQYTGHSLRHTYRTMVTRQGLGEVGELLVAHKIAGMRGRYIHRSDLFAPLMAAQRKVSDALLGQSAGRQAA